MTLMRKLMTSAGVLALSTGFAAAAPAVVESDVNLRAGPGPDYAVIATLPAGATVNVMGCEASWCRVSFAGTSGFASRGYLDVAAAAPIGPGYRTVDEGFAYRGYQPGYVEGDYAYGGESSPGYVGTPAYRGSYGFYEGERGIRSERTLSNVRTFGSESTVRGERVGAADVRREQAATEIQGNNPMLNPKSTAPKSTGPANANANVNVNARAEVRGGGVNARGNVAAPGSGNVAARGANANATANANANASATTGAAPRGGEPEDHGPNFIGSGAKFRDNHP
jgi:hypothetical protein